VVLQAKQGADLHQQKEMIDPAAAEKFVDYFLATGTWQLYSYKCMVRCLE